MGLFDRKKSPEAMEEELEYSKMEAEILTYKSATEERKAVIAQLKKQYGTNWAKRLGISKLLDLQSLKGFLASSKAGLRATAGDRKGTRVI